MTLPTLIELCRRLEGPTQRLLAVVQPIAHGAEDPHRGAIGTPDQLEQLLRQRLEELQRETDQIPGTPN